MNKAKVSHWLLTVCYMFIFASCLLGAEQGDADPAKCDHVVIHVPRGKSVDPRASVEIFRLDDEGSASLETELWFDDSSLTIPIKNLKPGKYKVRKLPHLQGPDILFGEAVFSKNADQLASVDLQLQPMQRKVGYVTIRGKKELFTEDIEVSAKDLEFGVSYPVELVRGKLYSFSIWEGHSYDITVCGTRRLVVPAEQRFTAAQLGAQTASLTLQERELNATFKISLVDQTATRGDMLTRLAEQSVYAKCSKTDEPYFGWYLPEDNILEFRGLPAGTYNIVLGDKRFASSGHSFTVPNINAGKAVAFEVREVEKKDVIYRSCSFVVRDMKTGQPLADVRVMGIANDELVTDRDGKAISDKIPEGEQTAILMKDKYRMCHCKLPPKGDVHIEKSLQGWREVAVNVKPPEGEFVNGYLVSVDEQASVSIDFGLEDGKGKGTVIVPDPLEDGERFVYSIVPRSYFGSDLILTSKTPAKMEVKLIAAQNTHLEIADREKLNEFIKENDWQDRVSYVFFHRETGRWVARSYIQRLSDPLQLQPGEYLVMLAYDLRQFLFLDRIHFDKSESGKTTSVKIDLSKAVLGRNRLKSFNAAISQFKINDPAETPQSN
ncbi:MAG: hypothetical protein JXR97_03750 [Planctomycetes bacterium]|nr:hypothetical protein [Planctomycetota bacterium]